MLWVGMGAIGAPVPWDVGGFALHFGFGIDGGFAAVGFLCCDGGFEVGIVYGDGFEGGFIDSLGLFADDETDGFEWQSLTGMGLL
jgi:hypothetical protein|uniref:Uncharacterized protein n=1 Tax=Fagus sylvatica TaxID=28930 RepID=A0A2N9IVN4_FAGSY